MKKSQSKKYRKFCFKLSVRDRHAIDRLLKDPKTPSRILKRALVLRLLYLNQSLEQIADEIRITKLSVRNIGNRYLHFGLERSLIDAPRPGKPSVIDRHQEKEIIALVCAAPPSQRSRWTLQLLREEIVRRKIMNSIGRETLRTFLNETKVKPWLEKNVVHWGIDRRVHPEDGGHT